MCRSVQSAVLLLCSGCSLVFSGTSHEPRDSSVPADAGRDAGPGVADTGVRDASIDANVPLCDPPCDDGNPCNGTEVCNNATRSCVAGTLPLEPVQCSEDPPALCRAGGCAQLCDPRAEFTTVTALNDLNHATAYDGNARLSLDEKTIYFQSDRPRVSGSEVGSDIYVATRGAVWDPWTGVQLVPGVVNTGSNEWSPSPTGNGLCLYFGEVDGVDAAANGAIARICRPDLGGIFTLDTALYPALLNDMTTDEGDPYVLPDERVVYFTSTRGTSRMGPNEVWRATGSGGTFDNVQRVGILLGEPPTITITNVFTPVVPAHELTLYLAVRTEINNTDIYVATRVPFSEPPAFELPEQALLSLGGSPGLLSDPNYNDFPTWISPDDCELYFETNGQLWVATRQPPVILP